MNLSDLISEFILETMNEASGVVELQRSVLANHFNCVPSQINYVLSTRFSPEQGYIVESQRGGGGYIRIKRIEMSRKQTIMHLVNTIRDSIDEQSVHHIINNLLYNNVLSEKEAALMGAALLSSAYSLIPHKNRDCFRARLFKNMLINLTD